MADTSFTILQANRLVLRRFRQGDLDAFCAYRSRPDVARYQSWDAWTHKDGVAFLALQASLHPDIPGTWFQMAIALADGTLVGDCGLHCQDDCQAEVGITLAPEHHGKGYATESLECLLDYVFFTLNKQRVSACTDAGNVASAALLGRVGFRYEALSLRSVWFKGCWGDEYLFALLRGEWEQRRLGNAAIRFT